MVAHANELNIKFKGFLSEADYDSLLSSAKISINPLRSKCNFSLYSFPSKVLQYLEYGCVVISSGIDQPELEYYFSDELFSYKNDDARTLSMLIMEINSRNFDKVKIIDKYHVFMKNKEKSYAPSSYLYLRDDFVKLAIFDICGTLYYDNTTYSFLIWLSNKGIIKNKKSIMDAPYILRALNKIYSSLSGIDLYRNIQIKQLAGFSYYDLTRWAIEFIDSLEDNRILSTFALMEEYKCKGYNIVIASATIDPIAKAIANKLSVEYYSSKLSYSNNMCSGKLEKDLLLQKSDAI